MWTLGHKYNVLTPEIAANELVKRLKSYGPFIYKKNMTRSSIYIHFRELPNKLDHKLRVSNHDEIDRYGYKWQLRLDGVRNVGRKKDHSRYFQHMDDLVENFKAYYGRVEKLNAELMKGSEEDEGE